MWKTFGYIQKVSNPIEVCVWPSGIGAASVAWPTVPSSKSFGMPIPLEGVQRGPRPPDDCFLQYFVPDWFELVTLWLLLSVERLIDR